MALDYELKLGRAFNHLTGLQTEVSGWLGGDHHTIRYEYDPNARWDGPVPPGNPDPATMSTYYLAGGVFIPNQGPGTVPDRVGFGWGKLEAFVTAEMPPNDTLGVLIGDFLHNLRSCLDNLAYSLAASYTSPLPDDLADSSEFPIFGDENRAGNTSVGSAMFHHVTRSGDPVPGSGLHKIRGWHPDAQTTVEGLQPYYRGTAYREDLLWLLHDLDRIDKHRLLHTAVASSFGTLMEPGASQNVRCIGPGFMRVFGGAVETDTPIALIYGLHPIDPGAEMHVEIRPAFDLGLDPQTPVAPFATRMPLMRLLTDIYTHIGGTIIPALTPYL